MQFLVTAHDGEGMLPKRMEVRQRHLDGVARLGDKVVCAGGLIDDDGNLKGSALILDFPTRDELDAYLASEPYVTEGVWEDVTVEPMRVVIEAGKKVGA